MTTEVQNAPSASLPPERSKRRTFVWRALATALILVIMVGLAHMLRNPTRIGRGLDAASASKAGVDPFAPPPPQKAPDADEANRRKSQDLRKIVGGLVMEAADEEGSYKDPANRDPEDRRRFLSRIFGLPFDYPQDQVTDDVAPKGAHVLALFEDPGGHGRRVTLMRVPGDIDQALAAIHNHYKAAGYRALEQVEPKARADREWLVRFVKGGGERLVYARPRDSAKETLIAVYDESR